MSHNQKIIAAVVAGLVVIAVAWLLFWETPGVSDRTPPSTSTNVQTPPPVTTAPPAASPPAGRDAGGAGPQPSTPTNP